MVKQVKLLDKINVQKYIYLTTLFISEEISTNEFETTFLHIRRNDEYLFKGLFGGEIEQILGTFFLDVSDYTSVELWTPEFEGFSIDEAELRKRAVETIRKLKEQCSK
jgi:hypothetical protein